MEISLKRPLPRLAQSAFALLCGALVQAPVWADIYLCVDAQGRREMTDVKKPGCRPLIVTGAIPAPPGRSGSVLRLTARCRFTSTSATTVAGG